MIRARGWIAAGAAVLAIAACQKKTETAATNAAPAASEAGSPAPPALKRKAGLWEMKMASAGVTQATQVCVDPATDEKLGITGQHAGSNPCKQQSLTPAPGGWAVTSVCDLGEAGTMTSHATITGDVNSHYRVEVEATTTGASAPQMNGAHKSTMEATWKGPCPAGMQPGDMMINGMRISAARFAGEGGARPGQ